MYGPDGGKHLPDSLNTIVLLRRLAVFPGRRKLQTAQRPRRVGADRSRFDPHRLRPKWSWGHLWGQVFTLDNRFFLSYVRLLWLGH